MARGDKDMAEMLRGLLNSSFNKRSAVVLKLVPMAGGGHEPRQFSTWAPTCIAGIGTMSDTVEDRSVIIRLMRKLTDETVRRLRGKDGGELDALKCQIARWVDDNELRLRHAEPRAPDALNDRQADAWDPLLAIADVAGGDWPQRAREAALALCGADSANATEQDVKVMLLSDIREVFERLFPESHFAHTAERAGRPDEGPRLLSKRLLDELHRLEERPWSAFGNANKPLTGIGLAGLLHGYQIRSTTVRGEDAMGNPDRGRGYYLRSFNDDFARYLLSFGVSTRDSVTNLENAGENEVFEDVTSSFCHGSENAGDASKSAVCHGVTAQKGGDRSAAENDGVDDAAAALRDGLI
jgi:putative DNA primase/helicase